jgi:glycosyltransferase involved in cell wall biosynthesis
MAGDGASIPDENSNSMTVIPDVSIIIPVYNRSAFLPAAVASCFQKGVNVEVLVVDDGSNENISDAVNSSCDARVARLIRQENQGACVARNTGLAQATGQYVKFLDSDDELLPGALAQEVECLKKQDADVVVTAWKEQRFNPDGTPVPGTEKIVPVPDLSHGIDDMLLGRAPWTSAALYKRSFVQNLQWDPVWTKAQDWGWALTVCLAGARFVSLDIPSAVYKHHSENRITEEGNPLLRSTLARQQMLNMVETHLRQENQLTDERRRKLVCYYYRDRIILCEYSKDVWRALWMHCQKLAPGVIPDEPIRLLRRLKRLVGVSGGVCLYVALKKFRQRLFRLCC